MIFFSILLSFLKILILGHFFHCFLEREGRREKEREKYWYEREVSSVYEPQGSNPQPRYVPWQVIEPMSFWPMGQWPNKLSHTCKGNFSWLLNLPSSATIPIRNNDMLVQRKITGLDQCEMFLQIELCYFPRLTKAQMKKKTPSHFKMNDIFRGKCSRTSYIKNALVTSTWWSKRIF